MLSNPFWLSKVETITVYMIHLPQNDEAFISGDWLGRYRLPVPINPVEYRGRNARLPERPLADPGVRNSRTGLFTDARLTHAYIMASNATVFESGVALLCKVRVSQSLPVTQ